MKSVTYRISDIFFTDFKLANKSSDYSIRGEDCEVNMGLAFKFTPEQELISCILEILFKDKRDSEELMSISFNTVFRINDFNVTFELDDLNKRMNIPDAFFLDILSISIGACRGSLVALLRNTFLQKIFLPIYNLKTLLDDIKGNLSAPAKSAAEIKPS
jgi:hypothetical protein